MTISSKYFYCVMRLIAVTHKNKCVLSVDTSLSAFSEFASTHGSLGIIAGLGIVSRNVQCISISLKEEINSVSDHCIHVSIHHTQEKLTLI